MSTNFEVTKVFITPEVAQSIIDSCVYEWQRPLRKGQVNQLSTEMENGRFTTNTIALCRNGADQSYLINGQHTLHAIIQSGVSLELPIETFNVDNKHEIAQLYARFDRGYKRTRIDTLRVYELEKSLGIVRTDLEKYAAACALILCEFASMGSKTSEVPDDDIVAMMHEWRDIAKLYLEYTSDSQISSIMRRRDSFSIGLVTIKYNKEIAGLFWEKVAHDDGLDIGDPRKTLYRWFNNVGIGGGGGGYRKRTVSSAEAIRSVALAWNCWIDKRQLKIIRILNLVAPVVIRNTPYHANRYKYV